MLYIKCGFTVVEDMFLTKNTFSHSYGHRKAWTLHFASFLEGTLKMSNVASLNRRQQHN